MNPVLDRLQKEMAEALRGLDEEQTQWRPRMRPAAWTIQQIVEHLMLTYSATNGVMETRMAKGTPTKARPSVAQRVRQFAVARLGYFPGGRLAPAAVMPVATVSALSGETLRGAFIEQVERMDGALDEAERALGRRRSVSHIVLGPMSVWQWRRFHLVHGRHHVKQIVRIRAERGV